MPNRPITATLALMLALMNSGTVGEQTAYMLMSMYPDPRALVN